MTWIKVLASGIYLMWTLSLAVALMGSLLGMIKPGSQLLDAMWQAFARIHQELWIVVPPCIALAAVDHWHAHSWFGLFADALTLFNWVRFKDCRLDAAEHGACSCGKLRHAPEVSHG